MIKQQGGEVGEELLYLWSQANDGGWEGQKEKKDASKNKRKNLIL